MWAYEYEAGKFIAGEILGDTLYVYAPTGRGEKWVMNSEGVVLEYSSEPFHKSREIIAGINAHFGTSFYQEDDIDKDFTIGETMPSWNAYEKMSGVRYAIAFSNDLSVFGVLENTTFKVSCNGNNFYLIDGISGKIYSSQYYADDFMNMLMSKLNAAGVNVSTMERSSVSYEIGSIVPDWYLYKLIR